MIQKSTILVIAAMMEVAGFSLSAQTSPPLTVAVLDFKNNTSRFALDAWEQSLPEILKTELSASKNLLVVERQKLNAILAEQALGQSGVIDEQTAQKVGELAGAQYILTGEINQAGASLRIDCHILKVESGQVRGEKVVGPSEAALDPMARLLADNLIYNLTGEGEHREKARLKRYPTFWLGITTVLAAAATGACHVISEQAYEDYQNATSLDDIETFYARAERYRKWRNGTAIATGVFALTTTIFWMKNRSAGNTLLAENSAGDHKVNMFLAGAKEEWRFGLRVNF